MVLSIKTHTWWINITVVNLMYAPQFHSTRFDLSNVHRALNSLIDRHIVTHFTFPTSFNQHLTASVGGYSFTQFLLSIISKVKISSARETLHWSHSIWWRHYSDMSMRRDFPENVIHLRRHIIPKWWALFDKISWHLSTCFLSQITNEKTWETIPVR